MIEIKYRNNVHGEPTIFEYAFNPIEYLSPNYAKPVDWKYYKELYFFLHLFDKHSIPVQQKFRVYDIWYQCSFNDMPFIMGCDEGYGFVWFVVDRPDDRVVLAEALKKLIDDERQ